MEILQTILVIALLAAWFLISIGFLITIIQNIINDRKREKREEKKAVQDDEYHEKRMKSLDK